MISRLPPWFRQEIPKDIGFVGNRLKDFENSGLHTVCVSAHCPNINGCFENNSMTFMILGDNCSRNCRFCAVNKGVPHAVNVSESFNLAQTIYRLNLKYAVITSVTRDDLAFGGAVEYARVVYLIRRLNPKIKIELLIPDFNQTFTCGRKVKAGLNNFERALLLVIKSSPCVIAHNLETVESMYPKIRPLANYSHSLNILKKIREFGFTGFLKSGIMLGFGESKKDVLKAICDLKKSSCDILTLGQYLAPSKDNFPVKEYVPLEKFDFYRKVALRLDFKAVCAGPLVRSSYKAEELYSEMTEKPRNEEPMN